jgi:glycosyltransferase involved in cell wall biosynthesis
MANFGKPCTLLPNLLDESFWNANGKSRNALPIGYMSEGPHTEEYLVVIRDVVKLNKLNPTFLLIKGDEADVISGMRRCGVFLAMGIGKDPLWGEGCPRTIIEALSTGCVVIAFDTIGNREVIHNNFNSIIVPRFRPDRMADALIDLYNNRDKIDEFRTNALSLINCCHTLDSRWAAVKEFLELPG